MRFSPRASSEIRLELNPLIDVIFLLLIFFAVSTTFKEQAGLNLDLPQVTQVQSRLPEEVVVGISADGAIAVDDREVTLDRLTEAVREGMARVGKRSVTIRADKAASHGQVVAVMDAARTAGAEGLVVATEKGSPEAND